MPVGTAAPAPQAQGQAPRGRPTAPPVDGILPLCSGGSAVAPEKCPGRHRENPPASSCRNDAHSCDSSSQNGRQPWLPRSSAANGRSYRRRERPRLSKKPCRPRWGRICGARGRVGSTLTLPCAALPVDPGRLRSTEGRVPPHQGVGKVRPARERHDGRGKRRPKGFAHQ
jgi:hypothetical protein